MKQQPDSTSPPKQQSGGVFDLQGALDAAPHGFLVFQAVRADDGRLLDLECVFANAHVASLLDCSPGALLGARLSEQFPAALSAALGEHSRSVIETGVPHDCEICLPLAAGERWLYVTAGKHDDGLVSVLVDISARKCQLEQQAQQESVLDHFFTAALDLLAIADTDGYFRRVNKEWEKVLGYTVEEMQDWYFLDALHPDDIQPTMGALAQLSEQNPVLDFTNRYRAKNGEYRDIEWRSYPNGNLVYSSARDITGRKRMEAALRRSEERYRSAMEASLDAFFLLESVRDDAGGIVDFRFVEVNDNALQQMNTTRATLIDALLCELYPLNRTDGFFDRYKQVVLTGQPLVQEYFVPEGYPSPGWYQYQAVKVGDGVAIVNRDITASKLAEESLRQSEERFRLVLRSAAIIVAQFDRELRYTWIYNAHPQFDDQSSLGKLDIELADNLGTRQLAALKQQVIETEGPVQGEVRFPLSDGDHTYMVYLAPLRDGMGRVVGGTSTSFDISERKRMEEALSLSEARQRALVSAIPDLVFRIARDGTFLDYHANNLAELAYRPEEFMRHRIEDIAPPQNAARTMNNIHKALETGKEVVYEYELAVNGVPLEFEARMVASGPDEVLLIVRNITERKQAQARDFELELEKERTRLLRQFIQKMSHEMRTPLSIINSSTYLLARTDAHEVRRQKAQVIEEQVQRMTRLVDMLLLLLRLEKDTGANYQPVYLQRLLDSLCAQVAKRQGQQPVLDCDIPPDLPPVWGSADDLREALYQILDNAFHFTPEGGRIAIRMGADGDQVWWQVSDTGVGMAAQDLPHIFETFWRHDESHSTPGLGLGLPIAQMIVNKHGGTIAVESVLGQGSTFRVSLPIAKQ